MKKIAKILISGIAPVIALTSISAHAEQGNGAIVIDSDECFLTVDVGEPFGEVELNGYADHRHVTVTPKGAEEGYSMAKVTCHGDFPLEFETGAAIRRLDCWSLDNVMLTNKSVLVVRPDGTFTAQCRFDIPEPE